MPEVRLIDANALEPDAEWDAYYDGFLSYSQANIDAAPTIEAEPVRHGRWIMLEPYGAHHTHRRKCSECGEIKVQELTKFCPNCGADMRDGGADNG